jgi:Cro/C1-type HTH DNA-binding domain
MEKGLASIHVHTLNKIADALQVRPFDLLNYVPEEDDLGYVVETMRKDARANIIVDARIRSLADVSSHRQSLISVDGKQCGMSERAN